MYVCRLNSDIMHISCKCIAVNCISHLELFSMRTANKAVFFAWFKLKYSGININNILLWDFLADLLVRILGIHCQGWVIIGSGLFRHFSEQTTHHYISLLGFYYVLLSGPDNCAWVIKWIQLYSPLPHSPPTFETTSLLQIKTLLSARFLVWAGREVHCHRDDCL